MDTPWLSSYSQSVDDDLIEYSVKRWAPFISREHGRIVAVSTDDILHEYARRLTKPVSELVDRYRKIHNSRRRHRPKRGLSMIWNVNTNRPRVVFYWTNGRSHFWCCDPLQLCPARFLGDPTLTSQETIEHMVDYTLNVLSFFDPSPVIEGARHRPLPEYLVNVYNDEDSSASEETFRPSLPTASRTPSPSPEPTLDDPIIPYRPEESSSDIILSESDDEKADAPVLRQQPLELQRIDNVVVTTLTQTPIRSRNLNQILCDSTDVDNVIATIQGVTNGGNNELLCTVQTIRHRSMFSPGSALYTPLIASNITFPPNVRPVPIMFDFARPIEPGRVHVETQTEAQLSQTSSVEVAPTQGQHVVSSESTADAVMASTQDQPVMSSDTTTPDVVQSQPDEALAQAESPMDVLHSPLPGTADDSQPLLSSNRPMPVVPSYEEVVQDLDDPMLSSDAERAAMLSQMTGEYMMTQPDDTGSEPTPLSYWRQQFPYILHFCSQAADELEAGQQFRLYIRFDYDESVECPRYVVANAMSTLAPSVLIKWVCNQSLLEAPFTSTCKQQYALVPFADNRGICLCLNEAAWQEFGHAALLETIRKKPEYPGPNEKLAEAWSLACERYLKDQQRSYSIQRFHDDILDALTFDEVRSNYPHEPQPTQTRASGDSEKSVERQPLSDSVEVTPQPHSTETESEAADCQLPASDPSISQTLYCLLENVASQLAA